MVSNEIATYRQKVTTFLDGMPILGQQGSVPFTVIQQVEVLRGPQSAAFGRSTFGGAINYTTQDPGDIFEGDVSLDVGTDGILGIGSSNSGPLIEGVLGGLIAVESNERDGESDWVTPAEGFTLGGESSQNALVKLVYTPTDNMALEFRYKKLEVDNEQTARAFFLLTTLTESFTQMLLLVLPLVEQVCQSHLVPMWEHSVPLIKCLSITMPLLVLMSHL